MEQWRAERSDRSGRLAHVLRQRQSHLVSPFPRHLKSPALPVDVSKPQLGHIAGAKTQLRQQQHNRAIAKTPRSTAITDSDEPTQFFSREAPRERGQPPMSNRRHGQSEIGFGLTAEIEIPQERSQGSDQLLCRAGSRQARPVQQKRSHAQRSPLAHILAERVE
jgi:hypothetical protein